jgi:hypothetical protein
VDFKDPRRTRYPKNSASWYAAYVKQQQQFEGFATSTAGQQEKSFAASLPCYGIFGAHSVLGSGLVTNAVASSVLVLASMSLLLVCSCNKR